MTETGSFLGRWARRKQEAKAEPRPADATPDAPVPAEAPPTAEEHEARLATLPRIEDICSTTDISPFFQNWVPSLVREAALRKMWTSDPAIRDFIEVADYQQDWNIPGGAPGCGPLEPDFDTKAFLKQLFGDDERREDAVSTAENAWRDAESQGPDEGMTSSARDAEHAAPQDDCDRNDRSEVSHPVTSVRLSSYIGSSKEGASALDDADSSAVQQDEASEKPSATPARRRHGAALPR